MSLFCTPTEALKEYGILPQDITDIIITHHHHDHMEGIADFSNAVIHIQKEEYDLGKMYIPKTSRVQTFEDEKVIAQGIKIKKIGGHSIGSSIVICDCNESTYIFCGDEQENWVIK